MTLPAPDLADPVQRAAYRRELRRVAWRLRLGSIGATLAGALAVLVARTPPAWAPHGPQSSAPDWLRPAGLGALALGAAGLIVAIIVRTRHHRRRMAGQATD